MMVLTRFCSLETAVPSTMPSTPSAPQSMIVASIVGIASDNIVYSSQIERERYLGRESK